MYITAFYFISGHLVSKVSLKDVPVESISALAGNRNTIPQSVARGLLTRIKLLL